MRIHYLSLLIFLSCHTNKNTNSLKNINSINKDSFDFQKNHDKQYDIADLTEFIDTSKFIARLRYYPAFKNETIIELDEVANGINLCAKQPVQKLPYRDTFKSNRSLPFNQLCYWYADEKAQEIKSLFMPFITGKVQKDIKCNMCLDPSMWAVEIYCHGKYSSITKDHQSKSDSIFIRQVLNNIKFNSSTYSIH